MRACCHLCAGISMPIMPRLFLHTNTQCHTLHTNVSTGCHAEAAAGGVERRAGRRSCRAPAGGGGGRGEVRATQMRCTRVFLLPHTPNRQALAVTHAHIASGSHRLSRHRRQSRKQRSWRQSQPLFLNTCACSPLAHSNAIHPNLQAVGNAGCRVQSSAAGG